MAPILNPNDSDVSEIVLPDGNTASEVIAPDGSVVWSAIPDTVDYHWLLDENSGPFVDEITDVNATNNGTIQVTGTQYQGGAARQGDAANNAYINYGTLGSFGSGLSDAHTVAITINNLTDNEIGLYGAGQSDGQVFSIGVGGTPPSFPSRTANLLYYHIRDNNGQNLYIGVSINGSSYVNDGAEHTIVCRKSAGVTQSDIEAIIDGSPTDTQVDDSRDDGLSDTAFSDFGVDILSHAVNDQTFDNTDEAHTNSVIDDIQIDIGTRWTDSQVSDYHNRNT